MEKDREHALACYRAGIVALAQAFNPTNIDWLPHRYDKETRAQFIQLARELEKLVMDGAIEPNPAHSNYLRAQAARRDPGVQALIKRASRKTPIRAPRGADGQK